jgi:hypothetical protein
MSSSKPLNSVTTSGNLACSQDAVVVTRKAPFIAVAVLATSCIVLIMVLASSPFLPAIQYERENSAVYISSAEELFELPQFVDRLKTRALTDSDYTVLANNVSVRSLDLSDSLGLTDADLRAVAAIQGLRELYLNRTKITDEGIRHLRNTRLVYLALWNTQISDEGLSYVSEIATLRQLQLLGCSRITDSGVATLVSLEALWMVNLSDCRKISDNGVRMLAKSSSLEYLQVIGCLRVSKEAVRDFRESRAGRVIDH